jgi:hypothetical protein
MWKLRAYGIESHAIDDFKLDLADAINMTDFMYNLYVHAQKFHGYLHKRLHKVWNEDIILRFASSS